MDETAVSKPAAYETTAGRPTDRELVVTRTFDGPARLVFAAWTRPEYMMRWWVPKSLNTTLISCETDVRVGGGYKLVFGVPGSDQPMAFFGKYLEVDPPNRLVWTNEEGDNGAVSTLTLEEKHGLTLLTLRDLYPSKEALDDAIASGSTAGYDEQFIQLDAILPTLG
jgi:uncharacterized protein YndB with AHSA1/START domain